MWIRRTRVLLDAAPTRWLDAVKKIPPEALYKDTKLAAFHGDKILGFYTSRHLQSTTNPNLRDASLVTSIILSNRFLADRLRQLLPDMIDMSDDWSSHSLGTIVEAAISLVHQKDETAVEEVVKWLVDEAPKIGINSKGKLLEEGGELSVERLGGEDHNPVFQATARLQNHSSTHTANSKIDAEQCAAQKCLKEAGLPTDACIYEPQEERVPLEDSKNEWTPFEFDSSREIALTTLTGCPVRYWKRNANNTKKAFYNAMMIPNLLVPKPFETCSVDSWKKRQTNSIVAVLMVLLYTMIDDGQQQSYSVIEFGPSGNKARAAASQAINDKVLELLNNAQNL